VRRPQRHGLAVVFIPVLAVPACGFSPDPGMENTRLSLDGQGNRQGISLHPTSDGVESAVEPESTVAQMSGSP
jgi:hypothetical protein